MLREFAVVPLLLERLTSQNVSIRHGAVIGLGCVCEGLHKCGVFDQELASQVENVILKVRWKNLLITSWRAVAKNEPICLTFEGLLCYD